MVTVGDSISQGTYSVHSRFRRVVNFRRGRRLVSLVDSSVGPGPVNIVAEGIDFTAARKLRIEPAGMVLDGSRFPLGGDVGSLYHSGIELTGADRRDRLLKTAVEDLERTMIRKAMEETDNHQTKAADILGISERMLRYKLKKYRLK